MIIILNFFDPNFFLFSKQFNLYIIIRKIYYCIKIIVIFLLHISIRNCIIIYLFNEIEQ
jgi:hypothetical protein